MELPLGGRRKELAISFISFPQRPQKNVETEKRLRSLNRNFIKINGVDYQTNVSELEDIGELGNGTSGHVIRMRHKPSGAVIAVKVID